MLTNGKLNPPTEIRLISSDKEFCVKDSSEVSFAPVTNGEVFILTSATLGASITTVTITPTTGSVSDANIISTSGTLTQTVMDVTGMTLVTHWEATLPVTTRDVTINVQIGAGEDL